MKTRTIIGIVLIIASLTKLTTIWGLIKWSWFANVSEGPWATYFCICLLIYVGMSLLVDSYRLNTTRSKYKGTGAGLDAQARMKS